MRSPIDGFQFRQPVGRGLVISRALALVCLQSPGMFVIFAEVENPITDSLVNQVLNSRIREIFAFEQQLDQTRRR